MQDESSGQIEVAPEVLTTIAHHTSLAVEGVSKMAAAPADVAGFFRRAPRQDGVVMTLDGERLAFDIYVLMEPHVNVLETSRKLQAAVVEAIDKMVGLAVTAVNVHVEDVVYSSDEVA
ncbi:MAG: Asp23/Gls24 family envelope stress response protein [Candidatus Promineifilaceae bacterium]